MSLGFKDFCTGFRLVLESGSRVPITSPPRLEHDRLGERKSSVAVVVIIIIFLKYIQ